MINRVQEIYKICLDRKSVSVDELARQFNVTEKTIRIDLQTLEDSGLVRRVYGGAFLIEKGSSIYPGEAYNETSSIEKKEIGICAQQFIKPYSTIILDAGTTNLEIVKNIGDITVNVITNDLVIANYLTTRPNVNTYLIGGMINSEFNIMSTHSLDTKDYDRIKALHADVFFTGTNSINTKSGFMVFNEKVVELKKTLMSISDKTIVAADSRKFDKSSFVRFASFKEISTVITDSSFNQYLLPVYNRSGLEIIIADKYKGV